MKKNILSFVMLAVATTACAVGTNDESEPVATGSEDVKGGGQFCGGIAGFPCPEGYACVDDPSDDCDPSSGGADCGGICKKQRGKPSKCNYGDPDRSWVSKDPNQCAAILFLCAEGTQPFFDECGCGCETASGTACGSSTCGAGEYCCNESCGICAPEGGFCTQQFCESTPL